MLQDDDWDDRAVAGEFERVHGFGHSIKIMWVRSVGLKGVLAEIRAR
jgi:hypothetical protein